jgi:hypothetical protein
MRQPLRAFFDSFAPLEGEGEVQEEEEEEVLVPKLVGALSAAELSAAKEPRCRRYHAWRTPKPQSRSLDLGTSSPSSCPAQSLTNLMWQDRWSSSNQALWASRCALRCLPYFSLAIYKLSSPFPSLSLSISL